MESRDNMSNHESSDDRRITMVCRFCQRPIDDIDEHMECRIQRLGEFMAGLTGKTGPVGPVGPIAARPNVENRGNTSIQPQTVAVEPLEPGDELRALVEVDLLLWRHWHERHGCNCGQHLSNGTV